VISPHDLRPTDLPIQFGRYRLLDVLGQGGMARVFLAELQGPAGFRKQVAVKILVPLSAIEAGESRELFLREARLGGLLRHPNIVDVYELGEEDDAPYIAMELVEGPSLLELVRELPVLPPRATLELALQLCAGLAHAHGLLVDGKRAGLVHRDLKPGNVLLTPQGLAKIADFGIARVHAWQAEETQSFRGTPAWSAPEQLAGRPLDGRADLFALGAIINRCVTGVSLFGGKGGRAIRNRMMALEEKFAAGGGLEEVDEHVPGLSPVLRSCLRLRAAERIDTAQNLADALRSLLTPDLPGPSLAGLLQPRGGLSGHLPLPAPGAMDPPTELLSRASELLVRDPAASDPLVSVQRRAGADLPALSMEGVTESFGTLESRFSLPGDATDSWDLGSQDELSAAGPLANRSLPFAAPVTPFVGRVQELDILEATLRTSRLVTVKGPPGVGKSRLAQSLARRASERGPVFLCEPSEAGSADAAVFAVATALQLPARGGTPIEVDRRVGESLAALGSALLILDGVEVEAFAGPVGRWLEQAPALHILATARAPLGLDGETVLDLEPLKPGEAQELFRLRSGLDVPNDELDPLLEALDRLPLAIELAAADARESGWDALRSGVDVLDRVAGQSPLVRAVQASWEQLDPWQQTALRRLSVFRRGFFLDAAEAVVLLGPDGPFLFDVVESLLARSLLHVRTLDGEPRFGLYEPIRVFVEQQLLLAGERDAVQGRHAGWYARLGLAANLDALDVRDGLRQLRRLPLDLDNLKCAADRAMAAGEVRVAALATLAESELLIRQGPHSGAPRRLDAILRAPQGPAPHMRVRLLDIKARLEGLAGRRSLAVALHERALSEARALGTRALEGRILSSLGAEQTQARRLKEARATLAEALAVHREVGDRVAEGRTLGWYASLLRESGEHSEAEIFYGRALVIDRAVGNQRLEGLVSGMLGSLLMRRGDLDAAERLYRQAIGLLRATGSVVWEAAMVGNLGRLLVRRAEYPAAEEMMRHALALHRAFGSPRNRAISLGNLGEALLYTGQPDEAATLLEEAVELAQRAGTRGMEGSFLATLGEVMRCLGDPTGALVRIDRAEQLLRPEPRERAELAIALVRKAVALLDYGEAAAAQDAAAEAQAIAVREGLGDGSKAMRLLAALAGRS
jgi:serine/threonine protein kinase/predicted ATPase